MSDRKLTYLLLVTAFFLSAVAAYYSIAGLAAIFAAAVIPVIVMGSVLEVAKLVVASWLYRNWRDTPTLMRSYFVAAIVVLMLLTSMGIFGFLSKAHSDQSLVSGDVTAKLALIDEKLKIEKENIDANRKIITQLDLQVNETINRSASGSTSGTTGVDRSVAIRRSQAKERQAAQEAILSAQAKVGKLNEERAPIAAEVRSVEAEVGPVKYIAQLVYGQEAGTDTLEKAVRLVILLIVFVFDPLAVLMFIAVNRDFKRYAESQVEHVDHIVVTKPLNDSPMIQNEEVDEDVSSAIQEEIPVREEVEIVVPHRIEPELVIVDDAATPGIDYALKVTDLVRAKGTGTVKIDKGMHGLFTENID